MQLVKKSLGIVLVMLSFISILVFIFLPPIVQTGDYHHFADSRTVLSIPNFWNVLSNLPFLLAGLAGLQNMYYKRLVLINSIKAAYYIFFAAILLVAAGSAYYHYNPGNDTLVWDRLPMTLAFMSLLSIGLAEFISIRAARIGLIPFLLSGIFSITWWKYGEMQHHGDLRLYALVQYLPILLLLVLFLSGHNRFNVKWGYTALFVAYVMAKLAEYFDKAIYNLTGEWVAGHVLKHLFAAAGIGLFLLSLKKRKKL